jgi:tRNA pseudouridine55 synthase
MPNPEIADLEATVGKGTYIRALARDIAEALGTLGHVAALRRLSVGPFTEEHTVPLVAAAGEQHILPSYESLLPVEAALTKIPALVLARGEATRLRCGQRVALDGSAQLDLAKLPVAGTVVAAWDDRALVALAMVEDGNLRPLRVLNL